jgi:Bifunctional DNA primase/polymerase, N-terminal
VAVVPPPESLEPPRQAEGAPAENGTPTDHSNINSNSIKQYCNGSLGGWSPLTWALNWAVAGHLVIPLEHGRRIPHRLLLGSGWSAKAGTAGSRDPDQIKAWWSAAPGSNIGIITAVSPISRVLIIDIDTKPGKPNGWGSISDLVKEYGPLPETTSVITPSGGMHLYYAVPEGEPPVRCRVGWLPGVDIPWVVPVPPSAKLIMEDTSKIYVSYQWASIVEPLPIAPAWLLADIRARGKQPQGAILRSDIPNRRTQPQRPISTVGARWRSEGLPPTELFIENGLGWFTGSRDADCFRLACRLWFQYGDEGTVVAFIYQAWERSPAKDHPFSWQHAYHKIKQAERYWLEDREHILRRAESLMSGFR